MRFRAWTSLLLVVVGAAAPASLEGQIQRMRLADETHTRLEISKAFLDRSGLSWYTSVVRGRLLTPMGEGTALLADWGLSIAGTDFGTDATLANPEIGLAFVGDEAEMEGYVSVLLPLATGFGDDDASVSSGAASQITWPERFTDELWSFNAGLTPSTPVSEDGATRLDFEFVAALLVPRNDGDSELFARYALGVSHEAETVRLRADVLGLGIVTEDELSLSERTFHEVSLGVEALAGGPGAFIKIPVDDALDGIDAVVGVTWTH